MKIRNIFFIFVLCSIASCAGYHFNTNNNPLIGYDIKSIAVPMFINRSALPDMSPMMTKEIVMALNDYTGLKVISGESEEADAILIGIVESKNQYNSAVHTKELLYSEKTSIKSSLKSADGKDRTAFYYPVSTSYDYSFRFYLIKRPTKDELNFLVNNNLSGGKIIHPKVVLSDTIDLTGSFTRVVNDTLTSTSGGEVNFVKNKGIFEKSLKDTCYQAAQTFKQVVLNAF